MAAVHFRVDIAKFLLGLDNENPLFSEEEKSHALFWTATKQDVSATFDSQLRIVKLLIAQGANPHHRAKHGAPPNLTAAEFVSRIREKNAWRRGDSRGPGYRDLGKLYYAHRSTLIEILEKAEADHRPSTQELKERKKR